MSSVTRNKACAFLALFLLSSCSSVNIFRHSPIKTADYLEKNGNTDAAIRVLRNAADSPGMKGEEKAEMLLALSEIYKNNVDVVSAIGALKEAVKADSSNAVVRMKLGELYLKTGLLDDAEKELKALEASGLKTSSLYRGLGEIYYRKHFYYDAANYYSKYLEIYPADGDALYKYYVIEEELGNYARARSALASVSNTMDEKEFIMRLAVNWMRDNNPSEALDELKKAQDKYPELAFFTGLAYYQKGEDAKALEYFSKENKEYGDESSFFKALILWNTGDRKQAVPIFKELSSKKEFSDYCKVFVGAPAAAN